MFLAQINFRKKSIQAKSQRKPPQPRNPAKKPTGIKPWFVKRLPSRVEILEGQNLALTCHIGGRGCKPWFIKRLPARVEVVRGDELEMKCFVGDSETQVSHTSDYVGEVETRVAKREMKVIQRSDKPSAPPSINVSHLTASSATIQWTHPHDNGGSPITHYILEKREEGKSLWSALTTLPPGAFECELENMVSGKDYCVRIVAANKHGVGVARELEEPIRVKGVVREVPSKPGRPDITHVGDDSLTVTWSPPLSDGGCPIMHYVLERREIRGPRWIRVHKVAAPGPPYTVSDLIEGSQYEFRVYARNVMGLSEASELSKSVICRSADVEPPKFAGDMKDVTVQEGDSASFECRLSGSPTPEVKWFKNFREAFDGYKHRVTQQDSQCSFTVTSVTPDDCGEIECRAYNKAGNASVSARLSIHVSPKLKVSANILEGMTFSQSQPMRIRIPLMGRPMPRVIWSKDGETIESSEKYSIVTTTEEFISASVLTVETPEKSDAGNYGIEISNDFGKDSANFNVRILSRPDCPQTAPTFRDVTSDSLRLDWGSPGDPPDNDDIITSYRVEKQAGEGEDWEKCTITHLTSCGVYRLQENVQYRFRVIAENLHGSSDTGPESEPITLRQTKFEINYDNLVNPPVTYKKVNLDRLLTDVDSRYIVCEEIGRGKHGVIHRAIERATNKNWTAKFFQYDQSERVMLRQELDVMNDLHHPRLLHLRDVFNSQGEMAVMTELLSGGDLLQRIADSDGFTEEDVIGVMRQVCQGVAHLHKRNIVHLELKPESVLYVTSKSKDIKLVDFSVAQRVEVDRSVRVGFGSAEHCAPEIINYEPISFASDMWSLGVMAHVLLTGISPFLGLTPRETFLNISRGSPPEQKGKHWSYITDHGKDWVSSLLVKDKSQRMTIKQALAHPWLNGEAEAKLTMISLPTDYHKVLLRQQKWRTKYPCVLPQGRMAHQSAIFRRIAKHHVFERDLTMDMPDREPQVVLELSSTESYEGTTGRFKCKFQGKPEPTVKWYHDGHELQPSTKFDMWYKRGLAMLNVNDITMDDAGQYQCVATNSVAACTTVGELHVHELGWRRKSIDSSKISMDSPRRSMSFERDSWSVERRRSVSIDRTSNYSNHSSHSNTPTPNHTSSILDRRRSLSTDYGSSGIGSRGRSSSIGCFSNSYSNSYSNGHTSGYSSGGYSPSVSGPVDGFFNTVVDANIPPQMALPLLDQKVKVGESCTMSMLVTCFPDPDLAWFHNQARVTPSDRVVVEGDRGFQRLTILAVDAEDAGSWRCLAINAYGQAMTTCRLAVLDSVPPGSTAPKVTPQLLKAIAPEGGTARLEWMVEGTPKPELQWYKDRHPLPDSDHYTATFDPASGHHSLRVSCALTEDGGYYGCGAENAAGTAYSETHLAVEVK